MLAVQTISDILTYPDNIIQSFQAGLWTASRLGLPYHNQALDELHETVVNRGLKEVIARPSHFRAVELGNFMAYLDTVVSGWEQRLFKTIRISERKDDGARATVMMTEEIQKAINFDLSETAVLRNVFSAKPQELDRASRNDLLSISSVGKERMMSYVCQYALVPPTETPQKRTRKKLRTFTVKTTVNKERVKVKQATRLLTCAYANIQRSGCPVVQTCPYPLALSTESGDIRQRPKSSIRDAFLKDSALSNLFVTSCPLFTLGESNQLDVILDFMRVVHLPPPPHVSNWLAFLAYLWERSIIQLGFSRGATRVAVVIDKPKFLPPPRQLLHKSRRQKLGMSDSFEVEVPVSTESEVPKGTDYAKFLAVPDCKQWWISEIVDYFMTFATDSLAPHKSLLIDSPSLESPVLIVNGLLESISPNDKGEGDHAVWLYASISPFNNVVISANDTDIWVYGLALSELGYLHGKTCFVERKHGDYVAVGNVVHILQQHILCCQS